MWSIRLWQNLSLTGWNAWYVRVFFLIIIALKMWKVLSTILLSFKKYSNPCDLPKFFFPMIKLDLAKAYGRLE